MTAIKEYDWSVINDFFRTYIEENRLYCFDFELSSIVEKIDLVSRIKALFADITEEEARALSSELGLMTTTYQSMEKVATLLNSMKRIRQGHTVNRNGKCVFFIVKAGDLYFQVSDPQ